MPVRRRKAKRRASPEAEAEAWATAFHCEYDFFGEAAEFTGLVEPVNVWPPEDRPEAAKAWNAAARDAWGRVGRLFLDRAGMGKGYFGAPWALETFGEPESCP